MCILHVLNEFAFIRLCDLCGLCMCAGQCVSKERLPFKVPCVCGRGGALFHTQPVGNSSPSPLVVAQFAYPAILHSLFSHAEKQNTDRRILELRGNRRKTQPKAAACLQAQHRSKDLGAVQYRLCRTVVLLLLACDRLLVLIRFH